MLLLFSCLSFVHCGSHLHLVAFYFSDFRRKSKETGVSSASLTILERASPCLEFHLDCTPCVLLWDHSVNISLFASQLQQFWKTPFNIKTSTFCTSRFFFSVKLWIAADDCQCFFLLGRPNVLVELNSLFANVVSCVNWFLAGSCQSHCDTSLLRSSFCGCI